MSTEAKPRLTLVFEGRQFPTLPSRAVNNYYIILNVSVIKYVHRLHNVWFQNNPSQVNICVCILFKPVRIYGKPYAHKFCAVDIFWEYHPSSTNITRCEVPLHVKAWFHDSPVDIDIKCLSPNQNQLFYMKI